MSESLLPSIKDQIAQLDSQVSSILYDNETLTPDALTSIADTVKEVMDVPASELAFLNAKIVNTPIETSENVLQEAIGSVGDLKQLLQSCHGILNQVYSQIATLDISAPEMVAAAASFVSAMKDTIQSFIDLYRDEQSFLHDIILKKMDFEHKKQLIKYKHDIEHPEEIPDISAKTVAYSQEELMKLINNAS